MVLMRISSSQMVRLNKNTHLALVHPVEVKEDQADKERTSVECIPEKVYKRKTLSEELQRVCKEAQFERNADMCPNCCISNQNVFSPGGRATGKNRDGPT